MLISDLYEDKKEAAGTYAAAKLSDKTKKLIKQYFKDNEIPDPCDVDDMHCTILYSRKHLPDYQAAGEYDTPIVGKNGKFEIWPTRDKKANVLVLHLSSPEMTKRHKFLMKEHGATYDFDEYKPHVTFTYDFGDNDVKSLKPVDFDIEFTTEYSEDLSD